MSARALFRMTRPANALVAGAGVYVGAILVGAVFLPDLRVVAGIVAAIAFAAAGNLRNDITDIDVDRVAHPTRALVRGDTSLRAAKTAALALYVVALVAGALSSLAALGVVIVAIPLMESYERVLKLRGLAGNVAIGALTAAPFLVGALAVGEPNLVVLSVALLAALATMAREILKDVEDVDADRGHRRTLPMRVGARRASWIAAVFLVATTLLSALPWWLGNILGWAYVPAVGLADAAFLAGAASGLARPDRGQRLAKIGMVLALAALVIGRIQGTGYA